MKKFFGSIVSDKDWDPDASKVVGILMCLGGLVGWCLTGYDPTAVLAFGASLLGIAKVREG